MIPSAAVFASAIEDAEGFPITRDADLAAELFDAAAEHAASREGGQS